MAENDKIIVLKKYENLIEANIVKTKLDAFDVPCFLTEENLTHLTTSFLSGGIRLHIFEKDKDKALMVIENEHLSKVDDDGIVNCPQCRSKRILSNTADTMHSKMNQAIFSVLLGLSKKYYCQNCGNEFDDI